MDTGFDGMKFRAQGAGFEVVSTPRHRHPLLTVTTMTSLIETKKKQTSYGKFECHHNADPIYCALTATSPT